jgi:hypothetical protein
MAVIRRRADRSGNESIATLHKKQIIAIKRQTAVLSSLLKKHAVRQVLYSGTMTCQSGAVPVAVIPVRPRRNRKLDSVLAGPTPYAVLYVGGKLKLLNKRGTLTKGSYLLVFSRGRRAWETQILRPSGEAAATILTTEMAFQKSPKGKNEVEKAKQILRKRGIDINLVDIEVEFNGSTQVSVSFLIFSFILFEDPPLPYL